MRLISKSVLVILICSFISNIGFFTVSAEAEPALKLYVSLDGNDANDGSITAPFETLEGARDYIRKLKSEKGLPNGGITVYIREGEYNRKKTFHLTKEDSGTEDCRITYTSYPGEYVNLMGGKTITAEAFEKVTGDNLHRIPEEAREYVYQVDLKKFGYTSADIGQVDYRGAYSTPDYQPNTPWYNTFAEVFEEDERQTLARYPNEGYIYIKTVIDGCSQWFYDKSDPTGFTISYEDEHIDRWANVEGAKLYGCFMYDFADATVDIKEVNTRKRTITSEQAVAFGVKPSDGIGGRYYGFNILEELDIPGEYYIDIDNAILYYYPKGDVNTSKIQISIMRSNIITAEKCDYITIKDIDISVTRGNGVMIDQCNYTVVDGCTIYNIGYIGYYCNEGTNNGLKNSEVYNIAQSGVAIDGYDAMETLVPCNNYAINNRIHDFAKLVQMCVGGFILAGTGIYCGYNEVYNGPTMGIMMHQVNETVIEYNNIHHVMRDTSDCGAIYWGMSHRQLGQKIRYNYIHDCGEGQPSLIGVYADGGVGGIEMYGNIIANIANGVGTSTFGSNNNIDNNLYVNIGRSAILGFHCTDMVGTQEGATQLEEDANSYYKNEYWREKYPFLVEELERKGADYYNPVRNVIQNNIDIDGGGDEIDEIFAANADKYVKTVVATSNQIKYEFSDDKIIIDQKKIKEMVPGWEEIPIDKIGPSGIVGNINSENNHNYGGSRIGDSEEIVKPEKNDAYDSRLDSAVVLKISSPKALINNKEVKIDSLNSNVVPVIKDSRTLLPVRFISEAFGFDVKWDETIREVTLTKGDKIVKMKIDENILNVNGENHTMDVSATIIEGRTMIPLRALCETVLSKKVFWDSKGLIVVSDTENIVDSSKDVILIDSLINNLK